MMKVFELDEFLSFVKRSKIFIICFLIKKKMKKRNLYKNLDFFCCFLQKNQANEHSHGNRYLKKEDAN